MRTSGAQACVDDEDTTRVSNTAVGDSVSDIIMISATSDPGEGSHVSREVCTASGKSSCVQYDIATTKYDGNPDSAMKISCYC